MSSEDPIFSVSEFLDFTNTLLGQQDFVVQGEITGAKSHPTGFYFSLKDAETPAIMDCYLSPYAYRGIGIILEDGMLAQVRGSAAVYKPKGRFSFRVESISLVGEGSLKKAYEALKKKLAKEGLFERKRPLGEFVQRIGLITSKSGAVIDDFRNNLLSFGMKVSHIDARVEGNRAVTEIVRALGYWAQHEKDIDVLVLIRGGGSLEDLQAFNDELVVRAVFASKVPTIVSIGHHKDEPLAQMVADASASTPTATAHLINDTWSRLTTNVPLLAMRAQQLFSDRLSECNAEVRSSAHRIATHLSRIAGSGKLIEQKLISGAHRIDGEIRRINERIGSAARNLEASNPERLLRLGYSIVTDASGALVRRADQLTLGSVIKTKLSDGAFHAEVKNIE